MTVYKPEYRVGVDWDGDGYIHLDGVAPTATVNKLNDPLYPQLSSQGWDNYIVDQIRIGTLVDDSIGVVELQVPFGRQVARFFGTGKPAESKVGIHGLPETLFDGYGLTDVAYAITEGDNNTTQTEDLLSTELAFNFDEGNDDTKLFINEPIRSEWDSADYTLTDTDGNSSNLFDGSDATVWVANRGVDAEYVQFQFTEDVPCNFVFIKMHTVVNDIPDVIQLNYSDNGVDFFRPTGNYWDNVDNWVGASDWFRVYSDYAGEHKYWRVWLQNSVSNNFQTVQMEIGSASFPTTKYAQSFVPDKDMSIVQGGMYVGSSDESDGGISEGTYPSNNLNYRIETDSSFSPSGTLVSVDAEQDVNPSGGRQWQDVTFPNAVELSAGVRYWFVVDAGAIDSNPNEMYTVGADSTEGFTGGETKYYNGTAWSSVDYDLVFRLVNSIGDSGGNWDGNLIWVADKFTGDATGLRGTIGSTGITNYGAYSGISVEADKTYTLQFWVKFTSGVDEIPYDEFAGQTGIDLDLVIRTANGALVSNVALFDNLSTGSKFRANTWYNVAHSFTPTYTGLMAFEIDWNVQLQDVDGQLGITGWMIHSSDWEHNYYPDFLESPSPAVYSADLTTSATISSSGDNLSKDNAFDDDEGTFWQSSTETPNVDMPYILDSAYLGVDLGMGNEADIRRFRIKQNTTGWVNSVILIRSNTDVDVGGGIAAGFYDLDGSGEWFEFDIDSNFDDYRYWTIYANSEPTGNTRWSVVEIEMMDWATPEGGNYTIPTTWVSPFFYSTKMTYAASDFSNTLDAGTQYDLYFQVKSAQNCRVNYTVRDYEHTTTDYVDFTGVLDLTSSYQTVKVEGDTPTAAHSMTLSLTNLNVWNPTSVSTGSNEDNTRTDDGNAWESTTAPATSDQWIETDYGEDITIDGYHIGIDALANAPKDFKLQAYISDAWQDIDTQDVTWDYANQRQSFNLVNATTAQRWRILIEETQTASQQVHIEYVELRPQELVVDVKGIAIVPNGEVYTQIVSATAQYDLINNDNYLQGLEWQLGKKKFYDPLAYEGTMMMTLDNTSKIFSPANTASPLYGELQQNRKAIVQVKHPTTNEWVTMWAGWTDTFSASLGIFSDKRAVIECKQGVYRLREGSFSWKPQDDKRVDEVVQELVDYSGWRSTIAPITWWIHKNSEVGVDTYLVSEDDIWSRVDEGQDTYDMVGDGWSNKTKLESAIKDMLNAEDCVLWVTREGYLELRNRQSFLYYGDVAATVDVGTLHGAKYVYGTELINQVEVFVTPKLEEETVEVWRTKSRILVPRKSGDDDGISETILLTYEYEEGGNKTVDNVKLSKNDVTMSVYKLPRKRRRKRNTNSLPTLITDDKVINKVTLKNYDDGQGRTYIYLENGNNFDVHVDLIIFGDVIEGGEGISYLYEDEDAISTYEALHKETIKSKIVTTERQAKKLASFRLLRDAYPVGEFKSIKIISEDDTWLAFLMDLTLGDFLTLSEEQTGETNNHHVIIGERAEVINGLIHFHFDLARLAQYEFMSLGDNISPNTIFSI